jgi:hypothetical protein
MIQVFGTFCYDSGSERIDLSYLNSHRNGKISVVSPSIVDGSSIAQSLNKVHGSLRLCETPQGCHALFVANVNL